MMENKGTLYFPFDFRYTFPAGVDGVKQIARCRIDIDQMQAPVGLHLTFDPSGMPFVWRETLPVFKVRSLFRSCRRIINS